MSAGTLPMKRQRAIDAVTMLVISAASILLLLYVAFGEARRTYGQFQAEKLAGEAELVQGAIESYLRSGLPMRHFTGFGNLFDAILSTDDTVQDISINDSNGELVFHSGHGRPPPASLPFTKGDARFGV